MRLFWSVVAAVLAACGAAGAAGSADHLVQAGAAIFVGAPLTCQVQTVKSFVSVGCLERNPGNDQVYGNSLGIVLIGGSSARAAIVYYDKNAKVSLVASWQQPRHPSTGVFPSGKKSKHVQARPGDRYEIGGTAILCPVLNASEIACAVVNTKTLEPVRGTYAIDASDKRVEVDRITSAGHFETVRSYKQPQLKG